MQTDRHINIHRYMHACIHVRMDKRETKRDEGHTANEHTAVCKHTHRHTHTAAKQERSI